ncbi:3-oxoacyl-[acyl-carrier-protein] synthase II [Weissella beninensis]|uniref:3-oxoacyl-[acyl-carrier-protein] synthase 2 n=1 Tax=Periweissella beninensis TaxID=504936 RepID=A0ABT0VF93_9LACO|nr:beta-ketoacyl-ACP synthase II [Periweissella beninensis]MBM7543521.1 3-oxoacyl-[acyl-carrier-protein] synthase II [Periweissella beninensis]MCM2436503.1 beta-ketoacyl-ACP synthase II [Periweissella beninensis]
MKRVVITGLGAVTPLGNSAKEFADGIFASKLGFGPITKFNDNTTDVNFVGEVKNFDPSQYVGKKEAKRMDLFSQYAVHAATEAYNQSGLNENNIDSTRLGVILGSGIGGLTTIQEQVTKMNDKGMQRVSPMFVPQSIVNMAAGNVALRFKAQNISTVVVTACASATNALGDAFNRIRLGHADAMITGGAEASINNIGIAGFDALSTLSRADKVEEASIPFDAERHGFVMGEGAGILVLEELEHAKKRGAKILGEMIGFGATTDAYHMTSPEPNGQGAKRAILEALRDAAIEPKQVDYINAHGTATGANDSAEAKAIETIFGTEHVLTSSTKSMTGHLLGAAGGIEAVITTMTLMGHQLPVNVGLKNIDPEVKIPLVTEENKQRTAQIAMSNSFGFGGHNAVVIFKRWNN